MAYTIPFSTTSFTSTWHSTAYKSISPYLPPLAATGRNVIIAGGGKGVGAAIAIAFAQAGAVSISIIGRNRARLESSVTEIIAASRYETTQVRYEVADLTRRGEVETAFLNIRSKYGPLDILVSSTSALLRPSTILAIPVPVLANEFTNSAISTLNMVQAFVPKSGINAMLINISSAFAHITPVAGMGASASSKAAILKLMDYLAVENPELHIVNAHVGILNPAMDAGGSLWRRLMSRFRDNSLSGSLLLKLDFSKSKFVWVNWDVEELKERAEEIRSSRLLTCFLHGVPM